MTVSKWLKKSDMLIMALNIEWLFWKVFVVFVLEFEGEHDNIWGEEKYENLISSAELVIQIIAYNKKDKKRFKFKGCLWKGPVWLDSDLKGNSLTSEINNSDNNNNNNNNNNNSGNTHNLPLAVFVALSWWWANQHFLSISHLDNWFYLSSTSLL